MGLRAGSLEHSRRLLDMARAAQEVTGADQLDEIVSVHMATLLGVEHCTLMLRTDDGTLFAPSGAIRPLPEAALTALLRAGGKALDLGDARAAASLGPAECGWLVDGNVFGLLPLRTADDGEPAGVIALGPPAHGAPLSAEQETVARAAAQVVAAAAHRTGGDRRPEAPALEPAGDGAACTRCGSVMDGNASSCACGGELEPSPPPIVARRYRLVRRLGRGSYGVAYEAVDLELERTVAIKASAAVDLTTAARIRREARHMAQLRHPAVATVFGLEFWKGRPLLVMEFLSGGTLAERAPALSDEAWELMAASLADGLQHAHERGITHGDIARRNIGFDDDGQAKLIDFGLAVHDPGPDRHEQDVTALLSVLQGCCPRSLSRPRLELAIENVARMLPARSSTTA